MQHPSTLKIEDYTYDLPDEKIAKYPLEIRDASKLLVCKEGNISEDTYAHLPNHIPAGTLLVFNQTKVVHARLLFKKPTGGVIEVFCLEPHERYGDIQTAMQQKHTVWWKCMVGGAGKWKHGMVLTIEHHAPDIALSAKIVERTADAFVIEMTWGAPISFAEILYYMGKVPLPPYLHREAEMSDENRYQTIFAKEEGSVAAPTAALHFTDTLMQALKERGVETDFVTLHVGAGTFKPVKAEIMQDHEMHAEWIDVDRETIENILQHLQEGIIAVGTTSLRTLESLYWIGLRILNGIAPGHDSVAVTQWEPYDIPAAASAPDALQAIISWMQQNKQDRLVTRTQILIAPGYEFRVIKGLITNFHQPQSTLLLLVAALIGQDWRTVYNYALQHHFRFLSYGDGCLLLK